MWQRVRSTSRSGRASRVILAAIYRHRGSSDETGIVGGEEHHGARDLLGLAETVDRDLRQNGLVEHVLWHRLYHLGIDIARADDIHGDAKLGIFQRQRLGETDIAGLGGRIIDLA